MLNGKERQHNEKIRVKQEGKNKEILCNYRHPRNSGIFYASSLPFDQ